MRRLAVATVGLAVAAVAWSFPRVSVALPSILPGASRSDLASLETGFGKRVEALLADMRSGGWEPVVRGTWRDARRQAVYRALGLSRRAKSLHERVDAHGHAAAFAVDVIDAATQLDVWRHAAFYAELRARAPHHGLVTGGTWDRSDPLWRQFDLGWDPGHVQPATGPRRR